MTTWLRPALIAGMLAAGLLSGLSPAHASDCYTPPGTNQCFPTFVAINPATGQPITSAIPVAPGSWAAGQPVAISTTAAQVVAPRTGASGIGRVNLVVTVKTTTAGTNVYLAPSSSVTTTNGVILPCTQGASRTITTTAAVFGITDTGSCAVDVQETY